MKTLSQLREEIGGIDQKMAALFDQRMHLAEQVAEVKKQQQRPVLDSAREQELIERNTALVPTLRFRDKYPAFLQQLMDLSKQVQREYLGQNKVGYQGTQGAFSQLALEQAFPYAQSVAFDTFEQVFCAVEAGQIAYGVIPFENSYTGEVGEVLDLLFVHRCYINQVIDLKVEQTLLAPKGAKLAEIRMVYSHPQAISQCAGFLKDNRLTAVPYPNTAMAAQYVSEQKDPTLAAIASKHTAALYGLEVLVDHINTSFENTTRFIIISKTLLGQGKHFNLLFTVDHTAGQLAKVMQTIGNQGFNMESIKSRSLHHKPWQYMFYVEVEGSLAEEKTQRLLEKMKEQCVTLKPIGGYDVQSKK